MATPITTTGPSGLSLLQMIWKCIDWTDPDNPLLKTSGSGGGGGGGDVAVTSIAPGDNNIGNVDIASFPSNTFAGLTPVTMDFDTGAGVVNLPFFGLAKSASGGPVELGTSSNPIRTDTTGTTTQPVSIASNVSTRGASVSSCIDTPAVTVNATNTPIITADGNRLQITFRNTGAQDIWVNHTNNAVVGRGWYIKANGGERSFYGGAAAKAWNGISVSSTSTVSIGGSAV